MSESFWPGIAKKVTLCQPLIKNRLLITPEVEGNLWASQP